MAKMSVANYALDLSPMDRVDLEIEMRFVCATVPWAELAAMADFTKTESVFRETFDTASNTRMRVDVQDGSVECIRKEQLTRIFCPAFDRYAHINKECSDVTVPPTGVTTPEIRRTSFVPAENTCPRLDITIKQTGDPNIEVECAPFCAADNEEVVLAKCRNFEEMCDIVHRMLKTPLGQFSQPMPVALTRDRLKIATGKHYLTSLKLDGVRRLLELRLHITGHKLGRRASAHVYASRTMSLLHHADIAAHLQTLPESVEDQIAQTGFANIHLLIDAEQIGRSLHIIDMTDASPNAGNRAADEFMSRLRQVRSWLPLLQDVFVKGPAPKLYDLIKVKPYFAEAVLKKKCAVNLQKQDLQVKVDGLIFSPARSTSNTLFRTIYKWKDAAASTIDLLYRSDDLLVTVSQGDESRFESILRHFPTAFTIDHPSLRAHTVQQGAIVECRIRNDCLTCVGVRHDKIYPNTLKTCLHTLRVVKENITLEDLITHFT